MKGEWKKHYFKLKLARQKKLQSYSSSKQHLQIKKVEFLAINYLSRFHKTTHVRTREVCLG